MTDRPGYRLRRGIALDVLSEGPHTTERLCSRAAAHILCTDADEKWWKKGGDPKGLLRTLESWGRVERQGTQWVLTTEPYDLEDRKAKALA